MILALCLLCLINEWKEGKYCDDDDDANNKQCIVKSGSQSSLRFAKDNVFPWKNGEKVMQKHYRFLTPLYTLIIALYNARRFGE